MGHISSLCKLRGDTAISVLSVIASCGVLCSSYSESSQVLLNPIGSADAILPNRFLKLSLHKNIQIAQFNQRASSLLVLSQRYIISIYRLDRNGLFVIIYYLQGGQLNRVSYTKRWLENCIRLWFTASLAIHQMYFI